MIDTAGALSDRMTAVLRRNSPKTREIIGGAIPGGSTGNLREGRWIATFQAAGVSFSVSRYSNPDSNYRNDVTVFFKDGYAGYPKFEFFALSKVGDASVEYDLLSKRDAPPDQLLLSVANYREVYSQVLEASLAADPSGDTIRAYADRWDALFSALDSASGAWKFSGCFSERDGGVGK